MEIVAATQKKRHALIGVTQSHIDHFSNLIDFYFNMLLHIA